LELHVMTASLAQQVKHAMHQELVWQSALLHQELLAMLMVMLAHKVILVMDLELVLLEL